MKPKKITAEMNLKKIIAESKEVAQALNEFADDLKCKNCKYYINPDYARCHECKAESEDKDADSN